MYTVLNVNVYHWFVVFFILLDFFEIKQTSPNASVIPMSMVIGIIVADMIRLVLSPLSAYELS